MGRGAIATVQKSNKRLEGKPYAKLNLTGSCSLGQTRHSSGARSYQ